MKIKDLIQQFIKFFGVGVLGTAIDYSIFAILSFIGLQYIISTILGNIAGAINNYILNKNLTFKNKTEYISKQIMKYILSVLAFMSGSAFLMWVFVDYFNFNKYLSRIIVVGIMFIINFIMNKFFVFNEKK